MPGNRRGEYLSGTGLFMGVAYPINDIPVVSLYSEIVILLREGAE